MERLKRKLFKIKKPMPITAEVEDEELYLEPQYSETESITLHIDSIAEELLAIAKKSSHTIRLSKLYDELLQVKTKVTRTLTENSKELFNANRQIEILKKTSDNEREGSLSTRYNRSFASDHSMADSISCHSIWSPMNSILSSSITTPTFRRRLAETSVSDINHSSVIQEHFVYLYQQLCSNCSKCSCYQTFIRNQIELEYLSICSYNEQLKSENDLLQRLLADCKYSYEKQYVRFSQYEQYLIEYEQCIQIQYELIRTFQQLIDRFQITIDKRKRNDDDNSSTNHIYQKINETTTTIGVVNQDGEHIELYRLITSLYEQCQRHISQLPKRAQLFSFSHDEFHPPANVSGIVDVADLEISVLFVDLLTLKHENSELRWLNERLVREKKVYKSKLDLYELTNKYFQSDFFDKNSTHELIRREKVLRLYVYRLYDLLETTSNQLKERQTHDENLLYQFRIRNRELTEQIRRFRR